MQPFSFFVAHSLQSISPHRTVNPSKMAVSQALKVSLLLCVLGAGGVTSARYSVAEMRRLYNMVTPSTCGCKMPAQCQVGSAAFLADFD